MFFVVSITHSLCDCLDKENFVLLPMNRSSNVLGDAGSFTTDSRISLDIPVAENENTSISSSSPRKRPLPLNDPEPAKTWLMVTIRLHQNSMVNMSC